MEDKGKMIITVEYAPNINKKIHRCYLNAHLITQRPLTLPKLPKTIKPGFFSNDFFVNQNLTPIITDKFQNIVFL